MPEQPNSPDSSTACTGVLQPGVPERKCWDLLLLCTDFSGKLLLAHPSCTPRGGPAVAVGALQGRRVGAGSCPPSWQGDLACPPNQDTAAPGGVTRDKGDMHIHNWKRKNRSFAQLSEQMEFSVDSSISLQGPVVLDQVGVTTKSVTRSSSTLQEMLRFRL